ncbi:MAG: aminotransferase class I/II-fold pyridoxal phosphate-dependent enzyme [Actinomycetota bacterium]|nr:aminotransferase class I/II-fold pyridoxal phosphate-dependent enzyme [Actinomycetota bacterium]
MAPVLDPSSTYWFTDADEFADASHDKTGGGYVYSRWANPTVDAFEAAVADLEGTEGAEAFASGMAAITSICLALCKSGDRIVAARQLYGGSHELLSSMLPRYGITAELFDVHDFDGIERALDGARFLFCETIGNPRIVVADLPTLANLAQNAGVPLVVDNTFASPALCRPVELGATLSVHSATKFIGGHHDLLGGIACGSIEALDPVAELNREFGATLSPFNAWLALRGLMTLPLRVERACSSALRVAEYLSGHSRIDRVYYPGLDDDPSKPLADKLLGGAGGGTLGFDVAGGREPAARFQEALRLTRPAASLGGVHSLIVHAASITHTQLNAEQLGSIGIAEGFCRMSVGLEDPNDIIDDLRNALEETA